VWLNIPAKMTQELFHPLLKEAITTLITCKMIRGVQLILSTFAVGI
jgi:hypothetical protein